MRLQEFQHAGLEHLVADREHVVAAGNVQRLAFGSTAASSSAEPAIGSLLPTAISAGVWIAAACSRVSTCREPRMQAASARRSDFVLSAKSRNMYPCGSLTSANDGASSASAMLSGSPTPSIK